MPGQDAIAREVLLAFWKVHVLHHAGQGPLYGHWMIEELRRHGHSISPGTLYPMLKRMEGLGWLRSREARGEGKGHARREYRLTAEGRKVLKKLRVQVAELHREVAEESEYAH